MLAAIDFTLVILGALFIAAVLVLVAAFYFGPPGDDEEEGDRSNRHTPSR